jgi:agmatinase
VTVVPHTELLSEEAQAFIEDPANLRPFNLTPEKLAVKLTEQTPEKAKKLVESMMVTLQAAKYQADTPQVEQDIPEPLTGSADTGIIPLNTQAGNFNGRVVLKPALFDKYKREPGPFSVQRYLDEKDGIPTFANAPVAVRQADLIAGKVEVAFVGVPIALGSGWRDSKNAPSIMRGMYGLSGYDMTGGVDPTLVLRVADYGNIAVDYLSTELTLGHVQSQIEQMIQANVVPFIVGGDHSLMEPDVKAMASEYGSSDLTVLHLDAHYRGERNKDHFVSDMQSVANLIEQDIVPGENLIQLGLRGTSQDEEALQWLQNNGVKYHSMVQVEQLGWPVVLEQVLTETKTSATKTFVSFNMSVIDPSAVSGSGQPVPGGLSVQNAMTLVRRVCAETQVVGFEMLGLAPYLDVSYNTALSANQIMHACMTGIAMRKEGLTQTNYVDPMALSHSAK